MTLNRNFIPVGAMVLLLGAGGISASAAEGDQHQRTARQHSSENRSGGGSGETRQRAEGSQPRGHVEQDHHADSRNNNQREWHGDARGPQHNNVYIAPRVVARPIPRHYYGSGGHLSVFFGFGSGYRYGSPYYGPVYGPPAPVVYGAAPRYYGDVRLQIRPRDAAVYVDGYYAGIVDNFDGVFQRLTLAVGPHEIEVEAPGCEPQVFNVYVDPTRTVDLHGDLFRS